MLHLDRAGSLLGAPQIILQLQLQPAFRRAAERLGQPNCHVGRNWRSEHDAAGLARDAAYLLRPDTYVALADASGASAILDRYCADHGIRRLTASR